MVGPSYKENGRLISGEGDREKKIRKSSHRVYGTASWPLWSQIFCADMEPPETDMSFFRQQAEVRGRLGFES